MRFRSKIAALLVLIPACFGWPTVYSEAGELRIAVASNFAHTARVLAEQFEEISGDSVRLSFGGTGKHYAQITNGAPFDAFLAADAKRPQLLVEAGLAIADTRFTYAVGRLVLWSATTGYVDENSDVLRDGDFEHLAIANPRLAPYGTAAEEALRALGLWEDLQRRLVRGENIGQTLHFVASGNAELGFVSRSQVWAEVERQNRGFWLVPADLHKPIEQQAVILKDGESVHAFWAFLKSDEAVAIIEQSGYEVP